MDKKTVTAILLIFLVITTYQLVILPRFAPVPPAPPPGTEEAVSTESPAPSPAPAPVRELSEASTPLPERPAPAGMVERVEIKVKRQLFRALLDTYRGGFTSWRLLEYSYGENVKEAAGEPLEVVLPGLPGEALGLVFSDAVTESAFSTPLTVEETEDGLLLWAADQYGLVMKRRYRFSADSYDVEMEILFENHGDAPRNVSWEIALGPDLNRFQVGTGPDQPEAIAFAGGEIDKVKVKNPGQSLNLGRVDWVGIGDRYFLSSLVSIQGPVIGFARRNAEKQLVVGLRAEALSLAPQQVTSYRLLSYLGPKERARLAGYSLGLEQSINYGWFSWLAHPFLRIMNFFFGFLHNWGLAILALTFLVKLVLFPITQNMYRSMRKMQDLQPKVQALKKTYKDDSQGLQRETMALYREYKVNPMAGCLPMFIQLPVFFALYRVLYNAIELRGASFLYIPDLSQKDPYYIAPLLMGATMILQQKMSPTSADPKQAKMMMFMPVIFTAMFLNFSSGLVLYFLFSNVLAIGEQYLVRRWAARNSGQAGTTVQAISPGKRGKERGK
jgi:YidC/Oxa1 family membrane protein insertase